jgi:hypothetical protein
MNWNEYLLGFGFALVVLSFIGIQQVVGKLRSMTESLAGLEARLSERVSGLREDLEELRQEMLMTPAERKAIPFRRAPSLTVESFQDRLEVGADLGEEHLPLQMRIWAGGPDPDHAAPLIYGVHYRHERLEYLPSDSKYPIAHGTGRYDFDENQKDWRPVRLLFSPEGGTLRGLTEEGTVKLH